MRGLVVLMVAIAGAQAASAADLDRTYADRPRVRASIRRHVPPAYPLPPPNIVVAPPPIVLIVPGGSNPEPVAYAPPPVYTEPPPLIAALPIIGPYLLPIPYGPPPATVLDAYDHRYDYNQ